MNQLKALVIANASKLLINLGRKWLTKLNNVCEL